MEGEMKEAGKVKKIFYPDLKQSSLMDLVRSTHVYCFNKGNRGDSQ